MEEQELQLLSILLWLNWYERNSVYQKKAEVHPAVLYANGVNYLNNYLEVWKKRSGPRSHDVAIRYNSNGSRWTAPPVGSWKLNCDGASCPRDDAFGCGAVIRDWTGSMVATMGQRLQSYASPLVAELHALRDGLQLGFFFFNYGLQLVVECRLAPVEVESDCLEALQLGNGVDECLAAELG